MVAGGGTRANPSWQWTRGPTQGQYTHKQITKGLFKHEPRMMFGKLGPDIFQGSLLTTTGDCFGRTRSQQQENNWNAF